MAAAATRCGEEGGAAAMSGAFAKAFDDEHALGCGEGAAARARPLLPLLAIENTGDADGEDDEFSETGIAPGLTLSSTKPRPSWRCHLDPSCSKF